jgi:hypothetical protein
MDINKWNDNVLKAKGIKQSGTAPKVVRNQGDLQRATLWDGTVVERQEFLFDGKELVRCAPYELHFIYAAPKEHKGWGLYCTCGSIAGTVGLNAYSKLASPTSTGKMIVCIRHTTLKQNEGIGRHADGATE